MTDLADPKVREMLRIVAVIDARNGYDGLIAALRARIVELDTCINSVDDVAMLPDGYTAKLLAKDRPIYAFGRTSLGPILEALGLKLVVVEDWNPRVDKLEGRQTQRQRIDDTYQNTHRSKAGLNRAKWLKLLITSTATSRSTVASKAIAARWKRERDLECKRLRQRIWVAEKRARERRRKLRSQFMDAAERSKKR